MTRRNHYHTSLITTTHHHMIITNNATGPTSSRDTSRHTPFYFVKETGCDGKQLPWFRNNYNMTLDDKGWQVMPGWAMCPGKMDGCHHCLSMCIHPLSSFFFADRHQFFVKFFLISLHLSISLSNPLSSSLSSSSSTISFWCI